jgi:aromatic-L-amino-acid decarboxylase
MPEVTDDTGPRTSLDPVEWSELRALGHRMLDDVFDELAGIRREPVWRPMPDNVRGAWDQILPRAGLPLAEVYGEYRRLVAPYAVGNRHPRFFGWVHGAGTAVGVLAELLAAGLNANCGGRDHAPIACERQVIQWAAEMLGLPQGSSGLVVTGTSMANLIAVIIARSAATGTAVTGDGSAKPRLTAYASAAVHLCVGRALDITGLGSRSLRLIPCDASGAMDVAALRVAIAADRDRKLLPFLVVGTAGTVDTGAIDDLTQIAQVCKEQQLWFHIDAAFGAIAMLSPVLRPLLTGIERADSVAFDFHKWAQVPYDAGCIVVRDAAVHQAAFAHQAAYLRRETRGLAAGRPWPVDLGPELSRGFRALKVWMTIKSYGADRLGGVAERCCVLARRLASAIDAEPLLVLMAPVRLNIVCFRYRPGDDEFQAAIAADMQESGEVVLSTTTIMGRTVLRAAFVNHRSDEGDADAVIRAVLDAGARRLRTVVGAG